MPITIGINGFGRIGRLVLRSICDQSLLGKEIDVRVIVDVTADAEYLAYQTKYDSAHGKFHHEVTTAKSFSSLREPDILCINGQRIQCLTAANNPAELPWGKLGVDVVVESTRCFTSSEMASGHLHAGAKKVVITSPAEGDIKNIVMGVNEHEYNSSQHQIISGTSCTTHCLAMLAQVLIKEGIKIKTGFMTALNSYTNSQRIVDGFSTRDWRSGRAAAVNVIPTVTNATTLLASVLPELCGKLAGISFRVPTIDVSMVDFTFYAERDTSIKEIDALIKKASETYLKGYLGYTNEALVSSDFQHDMHSAIYDSLATVQSNMENEKRMFRIFAWYDNEWGYSNRVVDLLWYLKNTA